MHTDFAIHPDDDMFTGDHEHYESCGRQFAEIIARSADLSGADSPKILELPCGYGRVTRHLVRRFDPKQIEVADVMLPCTRFCAEHFDVAAHHVVEPINEFRNISPSTFDVAAMGSLVTHLSEGSAVTVMKHFLEKIAPDGIGVVTTHGECSRNALEARTWFEISEADRASLLKAYDNRKHGFASYAPKHSFERKTVEYIGTSYGVSLTHADWMHETVNQLGYKVIELTVGGWDNHQDVYLISR